MPIVLPGAYGKPRPALIVQSDLFDAIPFVTVVPVTSELRAAPLLRIQIEATSDAGLRKSSQVMVDKVHTLRETKSETKLRDCARTLSSKSTVQWLCSVLPVR